MKQQLDYKTRKRMEREQEHRARMDAKAKAARARRNALTRGVALMEALEALAGGDSDGEYASEYDGRMFTRCLGCSMCDSDHDADCTYVAARALLRELYADDRAQSEAAQ